jgi:hypothetical protein
MPADDDRNRSEPAAEQCGGDVDQIVGGSHGRRRCRHDGVHGRRRSGLRPVSQRQDTQQVDLADHAAQLTLGGHHGRR